MMGLIGGASPSVPLTVIIPNNLLKAVMSVFVLTVLLTGDGWVFPPPSVRGMFGCCWGGGLLNC